METQSKLSPAQSLLLRSAARRADGQVIPLRRCAVAHGSRC